MKRYAPSPRAQPGGSRPRTHRDDPEVRSHHIFSREGVDEILNLQPVGSQAKAYQVRDVRGVILNYGLVSDEDE
jgi:hypothetical protein